VATGFGYRAERRERQGAIVGALLPRVRDIRRGGSAALDLCAVAAGRLDSYYERGLHDWDLSAGSLIATEAGAVVEGLHGEPASEAMVLAAPAGTFTVLHDVLVELDADASDY
jgi:myo-inositol-1(or 4)-monophosphatase